MGSHWDDDFGECYVDSLDGRRIVHRPPPPARMADAFGNTYEVGDYVENSRGWAGRVASVGAGGVRVSSEEREAAGYPQGKPIKLGWWRIVQKADGRRVGHSGRVQADHERAPSGPLARLDSDVASVCALAGAAA